MDNEKRTLVTIVDSDNCNDSYVWLLTDDQVKLLEKLNSQNLLAYGLTYNTGLIVETD